MQQRVYFLVPDVKTAHKVVEGLLLAHVEERHIHILAKQGTPLEALPEASILQRSDFVPALERGAAVGGTVGTLAGLAAIAFAPATAIVAAGGVILASAVAGTGLGAWISGMIGVSVSNTRLEQFEQAIERGELLMMVDVPAQRSTEIIELIKTHHPDANPEGTDPSGTALP
jgi:hypothetical protein